MWLHSLQSSLSITDSQRLRLQSNRLKNMKQPKITQDNVHLLLPNKVAQLANRLLQNGDAKDIANALTMIYTSPVYAKLEQEKTKYWWLGINALYQEIKDVI